MKKALVAVFLSLVFCNTAFTESYYFKECKLTEKLSADYLIDLDKNIIKVIFVGTDEFYTEFTDNIKLVTKNQIVSEIVQDVMNEKYYVGYYLNADSKSVVKQNYIKEQESDLIFPYGPKQQGYCANVKADWIGSKEKAEKEQADLKAEKERKRIEDRKKQLELTRKEVEKRKKEKKRDIHSISFAAKKWIKLDEWNSASEEKLKNDFDKRASKICSLTGNFEILEKTVELLEIDKNPTFGIKAVVKLGINGFVECIMVPKNGKGTHTYRDGGQYVGEWQDYKRHGQGTYSYANGDKYVGEWKEHKYYGKGTYIYANGDKYTGGWQDNERHGQGTFTSADEIVEKGIWNKGKLVARNGHGTHTYKDGAQYVGEWQDDKRHGQGFHKYKDGGVYIGKWANDKREGQGTMKYTNGDVHIGQWIKNKREGQGTTSYHDGGVDSGIWKNDKLAKRK